MQYVRLDVALFGWLLKSLFGKAPATVEEQLATRWAHTFTLQDDPTVVWPSLSVDVGLMNTTEKRYVGCLADSLDLDVADGGPLGATWGILGRPYTAAAFGSAVARGTQDFLTHSHITTIELDDVALLPGLRLLSLSINNNMEEAFEHSSRNIARGEFGELEITGELGYRYTNQTQLDTFLAETARKLEVFFTGGALGNASYALNITLGKIRFTGTPQMNQQEQVIHTIPFKAYKPTSGNFVDIVLKNAVSTYA